MSNTRGKEFQGVLENLLELTHPLGADGTVNDLVVEAASDGNLVVPVNSRLSVLILGGHGDLSGGADGQDGGLGRVDDGGEVLDGVVHAHVGDGDGAALATALHAGDNGGDETGGGGDGDRDVDGRELADNVAAPAGVGGGDLLGGNGHGLDEEIVDGQLVLAVTRRVEDLSQLQELGHGDGAGDVEVRVALGRLLQSVGNGLSHSADGDVLKGSAGSGGSRAGRQLLDVLLGDLATLASALDTIQANALGPGKSDGGGEGIGLAVERSLQPAL
ncbi:hypothetical protein Trco_000238 [Trichoderma cornu-damae]|uniref:Uncharacterized protein n=1 Tax=Trichoderma cornu-damae TaxID=654480 RepID=A0A9P8QVT5_9HYPO|nr:hypothetical protein Trco_000238 [Trichoderma cornu-damae]